METREFSGGFSKRVSFGWVSRVLISKILISPNTCNLTALKKTLCTVVEAVACGTAAMVPGLACSDSRRDFCYRKAVFLRCSLVGTDGMVINTSSPEYPHRLSFVGWGQSATEARELVVEWTGEAQPSSCR